MKSITKNNVSRGLKEHLRVAKKHAYLLGMKNRNIRKTYADFILRASDLFLQNGNIFDSIRCFLKSVVVYPEAEKVGKVFRVLRRKLNYAHSN